MSWATIRTALATRLAAVGSVGVVHPYVRFSKLPPGSAEFATLFAESGHLNYWAISRSEAEDIDIPADDSRVRDVHTVTILVFYALADGSATENTFQDALDAVRADLRSGDTTFGGVCLGCGNAAVRDIAHSELYGILCHSAKIIFKVEGVA